MTHRSPAVAFLAAALVSASAAATAAAQDPHEVRVGSSVNITTCVVRSVDDDDEFVLTDIVDVPAHPPIAGKVVYWIDDEDKVEAFVGKRIQFTARIKDVDRKEIEIKPGKGIEIEGPGGEVLARPEQVGLTPVSTVAGGEATVRTTLVELDVEGTPTVVAGGCPARAALMATADAAAVTETQTETRTAAVAETTTAVTPPAVAVETARETVTRVPEAAVETARETVTAAVETPAVAAVETERRELPRTATPLPLVALFGLGSLVAAAGLRARRG
jgi:hypothetical protein